MSSNRVLFAVFTVALASGYARAQTNRATLQETVTEPSNSAAPNVVVELKDVATGVVRTTTARSEGIFRLNSAAPGMHDLVGLGFDLTEEALGNSRSAVPGPWCESSTNKVRNGMVDSSTADLFWR